MLVVSDKRNMYFDKLFFEAQTLSFVAKLTSFWKWSYLTLASPFGQSFGDVSHLWKEFRPQGQVEASPLDDPRSQKHQVYSLRQVLPKRSKKVDPAHKHTSQHQAIEMHALQLRHRYGHTPDLFILCKTLYPQAFHLNTLKLVRSYTAHCEENNNLGLCSFLIFRHREEI